MKCFFLLVFVIYLTIYVESGQKENNERHVEEENKSQPAEGGKIMKVSKKSNLQKKMCIHVVNSSDCTIINTRALSKQMEFMLQTKEDLKKIVQEIDKAMYFSWRIQRCTFGASALFALYIILLQAFIIYAPLNSNPIGTWKYRIIQCFTICGTVTLGMETAFVLTPIFEYYSN